MNHQPNSSKPAADKAVQTKPTDADTEVKAIDGEDFGPVGAINNSDTETRKNVNGDPNIIQGNKLNKKDNNDPEADQK
jgi:hypothetical protein